MKKDKYYVALGASAGGLESLEKFFENVPSDTGFAFIVIQHLSPDYKSVMDELLARYTEMDIHIAEDETEALANNIYLIPPRTYLSIFNGRLLLEEPPTEKHHVPLPIDHFFRSLARDQGEKAVGIILSGTSSDGTLGVKAIKEAGGMVMVEDQDSAKFSGMPRNSIGTGLVDYILTPAEMPENLIEFTNYPSLQKELLVKGKDAKTTSNLTKINLILRNYSSVDFSKYKDNTKIRRIERRLLINQCHSIAQYIELLKESDAEKETLFKELLIGVTNFFRNKEAFEVIRETVLQKLDYTKKQIRIWSAGCSTGEEAYSLTILVSEFLEANDLDCEIKCFATDIDEEALEIAGAAQYPKSIVADLEPEILSKYFIETEKGYQVKESIRKKVVFAKHNILNDPPFSRLDILSCRNLFIYLKNEYQQHLLSTFFYALKDNGYLFLGNSESLGKMADYFNIIDSKWKIFKFKKNYKPMIANRIEISGNLQPLRTFENKSLKAPHSKFYEELLMEIVQKNVPPAMIIDREDNIVQILGDVDKYLKIQPGRFTNKLASNIPKKLGLFVRSITRRLKSTGEDLILNNIDLEGIDIDNSLLSIQGKILEVNNIDYYYISFIENKKTNKKRPTEINISEEEKDRLENLEIELQQAQEGLQATIEELETSNEELQSSNEELIASNEELQSTNEELQSVNEELYTVNNERQQKIEELSELNNVLSNLLKHTKVGALYLDLDLFIKRVTPIFVDVTNIIEADVGRSIEHLTVMDEYPELNADIQYVLETLEGRDKELQDKDGNYWLMRVRPFRTANNAVAGVIVTMADITRLR